MTDGIDTALYDYTDDDEPDTESMTDAEFSAYLDRNYPGRNEPAPPPPTASALLASAQATVPTSTQTHLAELQAQVSNLDQQIRLAGKPALELQAQRLAVGEQAERLSDAVQVRLRWQPDSDLQTMAEDAILKLDELQKTIRALPAESMRTEADRVRLARAERERGDLIAKETALRRNRLCRKDLEAFGRVRAENIDARARKAVEADRAKALNERLAKARSNRTSRAGWSRPSRMR